MSFTIDLNGQAVPAEELNSVRDIRVQQRCSLPTLCELVFLRTDRSQWQSKLSIGKEIQIRVDTSDLSGLLFSGTITSCEHSFLPDEPDKLRIKAYDALFLLRRQQKITAYQDSTLKSLTTKLLRESKVRGVSVKVSSDVKSPVWQRLIQSGTSHLQFLEQRCKACGAFFSLQEDELHIFSAKGISGSKIEIDASKLWEANFEINGINSLRNVKANGWNPHRGEAVDGNATTARVDRHVVGNNQPKNLSGMSTYELAGTPVENVKQAEGLAQAMLDFRASQEACFRGVAQGNPNLRPGRTISIKGLTTLETSGNYVLTEVNHVYSTARGYVCELSTEPSSEPKQNQTTIMAIGKVTRVNDPDGLGRIQVALTAYDDAETDWLQVVIPGAGKSKGIVALPNVDDCVLVLCQEEDPASGVVLGAIFGTVKPKDSGVDGSKVSRFSINTAEGLALTFDDSNGEVSLGCSKGGSIKLSSDGVTISGKKINLKKG